MGEEVFFCPVIRSKQEKSSQLRIRKVKKGCLMEKSKKLVIVGAGEFAEIAYEYFTYDSEYEVAAFAVEAGFRTQTRLFDKPVIDLDKIAALYPVDEFETFVAVTYTQLNRVRKRLYHYCKRRGYRCASYISSHAFVWQNAEIGENTFIFDGDIIQYHVKIGNCVVLWSGTHVGHRSVIEDGCWLAPSVAVSGFCHIGSGSFIGVNASIGDHVSLGKDTVLGAGAVAVKSLTGSGGVYVGSPARRLNNRTSYQQFGVEPGEI